MTQRRDTIDTFFDAMDKVVDGAAKVLKDMPEPDSDDEEVTPSGRRVIDVESTSKPLLKSGGGDEKQKSPKEIKLAIKNVSKRKRGGVTVIAETSVHEMVAIQLDEEDWKKIVDAADWMRMVDE